MRIKFQPEDFIVRECTSLPIGDEGDYNVYLLEKRMWNTIDALQYLARKNNLSMKAFSYGGRKDRYAITTQHITVEKAFLSLDTGLDNLKLTYLGRAKKPFGPYDITGNKFIIVLRDLTEEESNSIRKNFIDISRYGFPNYFGEQRFGSYDKNLGFFGEKFLKAHYNGAIKCALCSIHPQDSKEEKERKHFFYQHWGDFSLCYTKAKTPLEKTLFKTLAKEPKKFLSAIHKMPIHDVSLYFSAYQSFLWNKMLNMIMLKYTPGDIYKIRIKDWEYATYKKLENHVFSYFSTLKMPTPGLFPYFMNDEVEEIYDAVLKEEGLHQGRFNFRHYRKVIIKSFQREVIVIPEDPNLGPLESDEYFPKRFKLKITFRLPKGAYATTLLKHLNI